MRTLLAVFIAIAILFPDLNSQDWACQNVGNGIKPSIEINSSGQALIAYMSEDVQNGFVRMATVDNQIATSELIDTGYFYGPLDIALDNSENPRVVYHNHLTQSASLASFNGTSWIIDTIASSNHDGWDASIDIDENDTCHVVSVDPTAGVEYAIPNGVSWNIEVADSLELMYRFATDIRIDNNDNIHIVYYRLATNKLHYGLRSNGVWTIEEITDTGLFPSLCLAADGTVNVAFYEPVIGQSNYESFGSVKLATRSQGGWDISFVDSLDQVETTNVAVSLTGARHVVSLRCDNNNILHLAYSNRDLVRYGYRANDTWTLETVKDESGNPTILGQLTSLALGADGISHITYYETAPTTEGGVVMYASKLIEAQAASVTITCPADADIFCDDSLSPLNTGTATVVPDTALLSFTDSIIQSCPQTEIIQRTWIATLDSLLTDTCVQLINVHYNGLENTALSQTDIQVGSICLDDIATFFDDSLSLGCNVVLDTIVFTLDSISCTKASFTRSFTIKDLCLDSIVVLTQSVTVNDYPIVQIDSSTLIPDNGDTTGSIGLFISCPGDSLSFSWSNGSDMQNISGLVAGDYFLTVTNEGGCIDSFNFTVASTAPVFSFICPRDTIIPCSVLIDPEILGTPTTQGYFDVDFVDNILDECPNDIIVERFWFATTDSINYDTCIQQITVIVDPFELITISDTLILSDICLDDIDEIIQVDLDLPCNLGIDSIKVSIDSATCELFDIEAIYFLGDECRDTSFSLSQRIIINNPIVLQLNDQEVLPDPGGGSGSIFFTTSCVLAPVTYQWSDGSIDSVRTMLQAGSYSLTVVNNSGCMDEFEFFVPFKPDNLILCPSDTIVSCDMSIDTSVTGMPSVLPVDSGIVLGIIEFSFHDSLIQDCPDDEIIQRTWFVSLDSTIVDTCIQQITIAHDNIEELDFRDSLVVINSCLDSILYMPIDSITLGCNHQVDSSYLVIDTVGCESAQLRRFWVITDNCKDTTVTISQHITMEGLDIVSLGDIVITADEGDSTGGIAFDVSCFFDTLFFAWSDGSTADTLSMVTAGDYGLSITNSLGCIDSFLFTVPTADTSFFVCPRDTVISCLDSTDPSVTGTAMITGFTSVEFVDSIIQDCPDDVIIQRSWIANRDSVSTDTCIQLITVSHNGLSGIIPPDTMHLSQICLTDIPNITADSIILGCNQSIDTTFLVIDTTGCGFAQFTRTWIIRDLCLDTSYTASQTISVDEVPVAILGDIQISGDPGDSSGSILFSVFCFTDSLTYLWSDSSNAAQRTGLVAGDFSLTITNNLGCADSFDFIVPVLDTTMIFCPPDTTISCLEGTDPPITGMAQVIGFTDITFIDTSLQDCPDDQIIQRTWIASLDSTDMDTCVQIITVTHSGLNSINIQDTLSLEGLCPEQLVGVIPDSIGLGCNQVVDTSFITLDTIACGFAEYLQTWIVRDNCLDTMITVTRIISVNNIPAVVLEDIVVTGDPGDSSGSIGFEVSCFSDTLIYLWSDSSGMGQRAGLAAGDYSLTVTNDLGCIDSFNFIVPVLDTTVLFCPPDTIISCTEGTDPASTGMAQIMGFTNISFIDTSLQDCPDDQIIQRTWIATLDSTDSDTCIQLITVRHSGLEAIGVQDSLELAGTCPDQLSTVVSDSISLGCNQSVDTTFIVLDTIACGTAQYTQNWVITDACLDTTVTVSRIISLNNIPTVILEDILINGDPGDTSGSINFTASCFSDTLTYLWSDSSMMAQRMGLLSGDYSVIITNGLGCMDTFNFAIPSLDSTILICPPDTTISCTEGTDPANTGMAQIMGFNSISFMDTTLQNCPGDQVIQRTWIAMLDSTDTELCIQLITITNNGLETISVPDSLQLAGVCLEEFNSTVSDTIGLGCNQSVDTSFISLDTMGCGFALYTQSWIVTDACLDTTMTFTRVISLVDIPAVVVNDIVIAGDPGDTSGSIGFTVSCFSDTLTYVWSDSSTAAQRMDLSFGEYSVTITNGMGCIDSFDFTVPFLDTTMLFCPPDTTISCVEETGPAITGMAQITGFTTLNFIDSIVQSCPDDQIIRRTWIATLDSIDTDSCVQIITVENSGLEAINMPDSLTLTGVCPAQLSGILTDSLLLGCNQTVDTSFIVVDTIACGMAQYTQTWTITDNCLDTTLTFSQVISLNDIPAVVLEEVIVTGDPGDTSGSISFSVSCFSDSLTYLWSDSSTTDQRINLITGDYSLTITNDMGCIDSFDFTVPFLDTTMIICPPDTTITCMDPTTIDFTGTAVITGFDTLSFVDTLIQSCPDDQILQRTWIASLGDADSDTCVQLITIINTDLSDIQLEDSLSFVGVCYENFEMMLSDSIVLGCNQQVDTSFIVIDTMGCGFIDASRIWVVSDECLDTTLNIVQHISLTEVPVAVLDNINIMGDIGDTTGSISLDVSCIADTLLYSWSNGSTAQNVSMLSAGEYSLTISNAMGCMDSFEFTVPFIDTTTTLFTINITDRSDNPLAVENIKFMDLAKQEISSELRNSAIGNYDYSVTGSLDNLVYVCPERNLEPAIADITVLDLIRGQRFILGLSDGCSDDGIAGDVNFTGDISGSDLVLMRRVMLGIDDTFPDSITWQFVTTDTTQSQVVQVPGCFQITDENRTSQSILLKGIKLGDYQCQD